MTNRLRISNSQISKFHGYDACEGKWHWGYNKGLELRRAPVNHPFLVGTAYHTGVGEVYAKKSSKDVDKAVCASYDREVQINRENNDVQEKDELEFVRNKVTVRGMVKGYAHYHRMDVKVMRQVANEFEFIMPIPGVDADIMLKIDNIVEYKKRWKVHELKTTKSIDPKYVENRRFDFQTSLYFHFYNSCFDKKGKSTLPALKTMKPVTSVLYDAVQKPSIRLKSGENEKQFLARLEAMYGGADAVNRFYMEDFVPQISMDRLIITVRDTVKRMQRIQEEDDFVPSFTSCAWCPFVRLCFEGGMKKANMVFYKKKEKR